MPPTPYSERSLTDFTLGRVAFRFTLGKVSIILVNFVSERFYSERIQARIIMIDLKKRRHSCFCRLHQVYACLLSRWTKGREKQLAYTAEICMALIMFAGDNRIHGDMVFTLTSVSQFTQSPNILSPIIILESNFHSTLVMFMPCKHGNTN